jgi:hypothetical protein
VISSMRRTFFGAPHGGKVGPLFSLGGAPIQDYWVNFIRTGTPNGEGLPAWRPFVADAPGWMVFGAEPVLEEGVIEAKLDFLEALDVVLGE